MRIVLFNPADWYWMATDGRIYSSARNALVYPYDSGYLAFVDKYGGTPPWPLNTVGEQTTAALQDVLTPYGITLPFLDRN